MKKSFYLFNPGRLSRKDNTLCFQPVDEEGNDLQPRYLPIETVDNLYCFGSLDANSALYNFLGKNQVAVHFFDYYEHYTGSFMPKEYLLAGKMQVEQTRHYLSEKKRQVIANKFVEGASFNISKNLAYYSNRGKDVSLSIARIENYHALIGQTLKVNELMGIEGNIRQAYYDSFDVIINDFEMGGRSKQPPKNEINALISFGNMLCYTVCLDQIYHTQLNPTISFLHEPGARRFSLALDLAEIFKPLLVDRTIFSMLNKKQIQATDFRQELNRCVLKEGARKMFVKTFEERLKETFKHRSLGRSVSYKHLVKLECYKLQKHLLGIEDYKPFRMMW
ncbi:type I-B CRISPR-associated endonuclease Cas1b [Dyadobacter sp. LHD-138]|uniref:type I-B CRISPR-associated endonuclease Cas1b n=1 Tax=Dyadobacter sp. LHD-138 TaxID=3071413 RepID=UPI0027E1146E|nr:type I-B CRISPR-associated endonuclease Cas1b [Dyadobacter sp. LHD-138]MDQ6477253.1 type I-B CRISPR-associated endonuclease Cas1b [Dyadobacter sp. LHD-138]